MSKSAKWWTVIGYYEDNDQPFGDYVEAETAEEALLQLQAKSLDSTLIVVDVIAGKHVSALNNETTIFLYDYEGVADEGVRVA